MPLPLAVLPREQSFGENFGNAFSTGFSKGMSGYMDHLAQRNIGKLKEADTKRRLQRIPGLSEQDVEMLSLFPEPARETILNSYLEQLLSSGSQAPQEQSFMQQLSQPSQSDNPQVQRQRAAESLTAADFAGANDQPQETDQRIYTPEAQREFAKIAQQEQGEQNKPSLAKAVKNVRQESESKGKADKQTVQYYHDLLKAGSAIKDNSKVLKRMKHLITEEGGLPIAAFYKLFKDVEEKISPAVTASAGAAIGSVLGGVAGAAGGPAAIPGALSGAAIGGGIGTAVGAAVQPVVSLIRSAQTLTSPNTQEFEKLETQFLSGAKAIFGARITDTDLRAFLKSIPSLSQTDSGKLAIIRNMENFNKAAEIKADAAKKIHKLYGKVPADFEIILDEMTKDQLDKLSDDFVAGKQVK